MKLEILNPYNELPSKIRITSAQGMRSGTNHPALDFVSDGNKEVVAIGSGVVGTSTIVTDKNNLTWQWGNYIRLDLDAGKYPYYCHLAKRYVEAGQRVNKGDVIGIEGSTGYSTGSHLHLQIRSTLYTGSEIMVGDFIGLQNKVTLPNNISGYLLDYPTLVASLAGFEQVTLDYFDTSNYKYAWDLWRKIYFELVSNKEAGKYNTSNCRTFIQSKCGFSSDTMKFIDAYKYADSFYDKLTNKVYNSINADVHITGTLS